MSVKNPGAKLTEICEFCVCTYTAAIRCRNDRACTTEWTLPMSSADMLKYRVFTYFWEKGYFLTGGGKFGGDFLIYPGMLLEFHFYYTLM